jgi:hypothetical protein
MTTKPSILLKNPFIRFFDSLGGKVMGERGEEGYECSNNIVNGPSFVNSTCIFAPKAPVRVGIPSAVSRSVK